MLCHKHKKRKENNNIKSVLFDTVCVCVPTHQSWFIALFWDVHQSHTRWIAVGQYFWTDTYRSLKWENKMSCILSNQQMYCDLGRKYLVLNKTSLWVFFDMLLCALQLHSAVYITQSFHNNDSRNRLLQISFVPCNYKIASWSGWPLIVSFELWKK